MMAARRRWESGGDSRRAQSVAGLEGLILAPACTTTCETPRSIDAEPDGRRSLPSATLVSGTVALAVQLPGGHTAASGRHRRLSWAGARLHRPKTHPLSARYPDGACNGCSLCCSCHCSHSCSHVPGPLAQLAEQRTFNPRVPGSIPGRPTHSLLVLQLRARHLATLVAMTSPAEHLPLADVKNRLSEVVDRLEREHGRVVITKHGRPAVVLMSIEDLEGLEETLDVLSDPKLMHRIRKAAAEIVAGEADELTKEEALALIARRR